MITFKSIFRGNEMNVIKGTYFAGNKCEEVA